MLAELAELSQRARETDARSPERPIGDVLEGKPLRTPVNDEEREKRIQEELRREDYRKHQAWNELVRIRGDRYRDCRLANFACEQRSQQEAVTSLTSYCESITERVEAGDGIVLFGPRGTGKDHLLMAVARVAIGSSFTVEWRNGLDLFGDVRDAMTNGSEEKRIVKDLIRPDVLYLSDPLPLITTGIGTKTSGALSEFQASMLFRILDGRYSRRRPTWCTVNVQGGDELDLRMGAQNADRLRDGALAIFCNWPSYRKVKP